MKVKYFSLFMVSFFLIPSCGFTPSIDVPGDAYNDVKNSLSNIGWTPWITETKVLEPNQIISYPTLDFRGIKDNVNINYEIKGKEKLSIFFFSGEEEIELYKKGEEYVHYPTCSSKDIKEKEGDCNNIPSKFILAIVNSDKENEVDLDIKYKIVTPSQTKE